MPNEVGRNAVHLVYEIRDRDQQLLHPFSAELLFLLLIQDLLKVTDLADAERALSLELEVFGRVWNYFHRVNLGETRLNITRNCIDITPSLPEFFVEMLLRFGGNNGATKIGRFKCISSRRRLGR